MFENLNDKKSSGGDAGVSKAGPLQDPSAAEEHPPLESSRPPRPTASNRLNKASLVPPPSQKISPEAKQELEDIFANDTVTTGLNPPDRQKPDVLKPIPPGVKDHSELVEDGHKNQKLFILLLLFLLTALLVIGGYWLYGKFLAKPSTISPRTVEKAEEIGGFGESNDITEPQEVITEPEKNENKEEDTASESAENEAEAVENEIGPEELDQPTSSYIYSIDTDRDGLSDEEEALLGTDINKMDTDADNLYDREEVKIYNTDPLNPDSDSDGYLDGDEVKANYNPLGEGVLFEL